MKQFPKWGVAVASMALMIGFGAVTSFAQDKEAVIKERRDAMKQQSDDFKQIKAYLDGTGDQATAVAKVKDMLAINDKLAGLWLAGTSSKDLPGKTNAKPEVWEQMDKFKATLAALKAEEQKLLDAVQKGDKAAGTTAFGDAGKNGCGACHGTFREKIS